METLCKIREISRSLAEFETRFEKVHHLNLNEGMLLCSLTKSDDLASGEIALLLGLTTSNTSKVIKSVETKGLIRRVMGKQDKRQMYFSLTNEGLARMTAIKTIPVELPALLATTIGNGEAESAR